MHWAVRVKLLAPATVAGVIFVNAASAAFPYEANSTSINVPSIFTRVAQNATAFQLYDNYDLTGLVLRVFPSDGVQTCTTECRSDRFCLAYSYDKLKNECSLKKTTGTLRFDPAFLSGLSTNSPLPSTATGTFFIETLVQTSFSAQPRRSITSVPLKDCASVCQSDNECVAFTYSLSKHSCDFFSTIASYSTDADSTSGIKRQAPEISETNLIGDHQRCVLDTFGRNQSKAREFDPTILQKSVDECEMLLEPIKRDILARSHDLKLAEAVLARIRRASRRGVAVAIVGYFASPSATNGFTPKTLSPAATKANTDQKNEQDVAAANVEITLWNSVKDSKDARLFETYLARYPNGTFADIARIKLQDFKTAALAPPAGANDTSPISDPALLKEVRERLYELNFDPDLSDGPATDATRQAIREFEQHNGLPPTGVATTGLLQRLRTAEVLKPWGAIVYGEDSNKWGMAWSEDTRKSALADARKSCGDAKNCPTEISFFGSHCGAFAHSKSGWAIAARGNVAEAKQAALADCEKRGNSCQVIASVCADGAERFSAK
jgi:Domain of unknown function (DUF4189)/Putative peptidoglycan binding domain/PAN domain